jgi:hypothetical protein
MKIHYGMSIIFEDKKRTCEKTMTLEKKKIKTNHDGSCLYLSYLGGRDQEYHDSRPAHTKS